MSDEKNDTAGWGALSKLGALPTPASHALAAARSIRFVLVLLRVLGLIPLLGMFALAVLLLWQARHTENWRLFWYGLVGVYIGALAIAYGFSQVSGLGYEETRSSLQLHKGIQALRQIAASGDNRLTPVQTPAIHDSLIDPVQVSTASVKVEQLQRLNAGSNGVLLLSIGALMLFTSIFIVAPGRDLSVSLESVQLIVMMVFGALCVIAGFRLLRRFTITADEQGFQWQPPSVGLRRPTINASWRDVRAFVTFRSRQVFNAASVDEVFLLDTTTEALAWRITPRTPASVREAHERFVRMANEHVQLRDITASLKDLRASSETRSYEYAVVALSGPAPVPPAVRKVLTTPVRESHFLSGYLIVATVLLALLIAAGLLLQFGLIPAGSF